MVSRASTSVVLVAALTGLVAARITLASDEDEVAHGPSAPPNSGATGGASAAYASIAGAVVSRNAVSPAAGPTAHDDREPDDGRAGATDEGPATRSVALPRQVVPQRDGMLRMPGGKLVLTPGAARAVAPLSAVSVAPFWIDRTEVTVAAYRACVDARVCELPQKTSATCTFDGGDPELPVSCVRWRDADTYCRSAGKRLPSELEWEFAARGNLPLAFPWGGGTSCALAVTLISDQSGRSCGARPSRVGAHPAGGTIFGVQDMSGNVEEWTADWYAESLAPGPAPRAGSAHVLRGGGWLSPPSQSRTTARDWGSAVEAGANVGFRCARGDG